jgi:CTP synthase
MQMMAVEFARNILNFDDAHSSELAPSTDHPIINLMEDQKKY